MMMTFIVIIIVVIIRVVVVSQSLSDRVRWASGQQNTAPLVIKGSYEELL